MLKQKINHSKISKKKKQQKKKEKKQIEKNNASASFTFVPEALASCHAMSLFSKLNKSQNKSIPKVKVNKKSHQKKLRKSKKVNLPRRAVTHFFWCHRHTRIVGLARSPLR